MHFLSKTFSDTLMTCKNMFEPCDFKNTNKHQKTRGGGTSKQILDQFLTQPWTKYLTQKPPNWANC